MSTTIKHEVRRRFRETRRMQFLRLAEMVEGAIALNKHAVIVPACDYPLLQELLAANEERLAAEEDREMRLEVLSMFEDKYKGRT